MVPNEFMRFIKDNEFTDRRIKLDCLVPIDIRVDEGVTVGADRIVNSVGAFTRYGGNLIIVDFGTATTFDVVEHDIIP